MQKHANNIAITTTQIRIIQKPTLSKHCQNFDFGLQFQVKLFAVLDDCRHLVERLLKRGVHFEIWIFPLEVNILAQKSADKKKKEEHVHKNQSHGAPDLVVCLIALCALSERGIVKIARRSVTDATLFGIVGENRKSETRR